PPAHLTRRGGATGGRDRLHRVRPVHAVRGRGRAVARSQRAPAGAADRGVRHRLPGGRAAAFHPDLEGGRGRGGTVAGRDHRRGRRGGRAVAGRAGRDAGRGRRRRAAARRGRGGLVSVGAPV